MSSFFNFFIFLFAILGLEVSLNAKEKKAPEYLKYVREVVNGFVDDIENKFQLHCYGSGGSMPHDVEIIEVLS